MIRLLLIAVGLTMLTVVVHCAGSLASVLRISRLVNAHGKRISLLRAGTLIGSLAVQLLLLSLVEISLWAALFVAGDMLPDLQTAAYFSLTSYTTVGYGDVVLPEGWRLLGPIESAVGILMFGLSTSAMVAAVGNIARHTTRFTEPHP